MPHFTHVLVMTCGMIYARVEKATFVLWSWAGMFFAIGIARRIDVNRGRIAHHARHRFAPAAELVVIRFRFVAHLAFPIASKGRIVAIDVSSHLPISVVKSAGLYHGLHRAT